MTGATSADSVALPSIPRHHSQQQQQRQQQQQPFGNSGIGNNATEGAATAEMGLKLCNMAASTVHAASTLPPNDKSTEYDNTKNNKSDENNDSDSENCNPIILKVEWNYDENDYEKGPTSWPTGQQQSPIDLQLSRCRTITIDEDPLKFVNYSKPIHGEFVNTGYSVQFLPNSQIDVPEICGALLDQNYRFIQYHYHWSQNDSHGSEHSFGGLFYSAELHLVHQGVKDPSKLAVLAIFLKVDNRLKNNRDNNDEDDEQKQNQQLHLCHKALNADQEALQQIKLCGQRRESQLCLAEKLPENFTFMRYNGSLTTPPCTENVTWTVFTDPVDITQQQLNALRQLRDHSNRVISCNCRATQNLNGRKMCLAI